jgi:hypothetical protein
MGGGSIVAKRLIGLVDQADQFFQSLQASDQDCAMICRTGGEEACPVTSQEHGLTPSERLVAGLCHRSFLRLWTHPNAKGKKGKELCDCLIVCDRHVVIVSVKDCAYRNTGDTTGWERWKKKAIEESMSQIAGAERWLATIDHVERADGRIVQLPPHDVRQYHRIAVALGANGEVPVEWGDKGKGFIHLCDERSLEAIFASLDTITDFVKFLSDTEALFAGGTRIIFSGGGIEDLLALYLGWGEKYIHCAAPQKACLTRPS